MALEIHQSTVGTVMLSGDDSSVQIIWNNIIGKNFAIGDFKDKGETELTSYMLYVDTVVQEQMFIPRRSKELYLVKDGKVIDEELRFSMMVHKRPVMKGLCKFDKIAKVVPNMNGYELELTAEAEHEVRKWTKNSLRFTLYKIDDKGYRLLANYNNKIGSITVAYIDAKSIPFDKMDELENFTPVQRLLKTCSVTSTSVRLPKVQLSAKEYQEVKKTLENIGGKWNTQGQVFFFDHDPKPLVDQLIKGDKVNLKQDFQFFATPKDLVAEMVKRADIQPTDVCLEPSAGKGAIVEQLIPLAKKVEMCEFMKQNRDFLEQEMGYEVAWGDFLELNTQWKYDKIVANPPFSKNQDVDHVFKMYEHLNKGGKIVAIISTTWKTGKQKKQVEFREFLKSVGAIETEVAEGTFKDSGTGVKTMMVEIVKK
jgi:hypothetical protein